MDGELTSQAQLDGSHGGDQHAITVAMLSELIAQGAANPYLVAALDDCYPYGNDGLPLRYQYAWRHLNSGRYAEHALMKGAMECVDPRSGQTVVAQRSWVLPLDWVCIAYEFSGVNRFILITSSFDQAKLAIYFPDTSLLVIGQVDEGWKQIAIKSCNELQQRLAQTDPRVLEAGDPGRPDAKGILHLGFMNNMGHFMWNELSGIELALQGGALEKINTVVVGPHEYFPVGEIFPELVSSGVSIKKWAKPVPPCVEYSSFLPLRLAGNRISLTLRQRIASWALRASVAALPEIAQYNDAGFNLWFNLRAHNKAWEGQVQGIVQIAASMRQALTGGQPLRLILDGTPDTSAMADSIADKTQGWAEVVNATQVPIAKTIALSSLIDLHICVVGSGLTIPHWIMGRRGVAHANRAHLAQQNWWNCVSEGVHDVIFINESAIHDGTAPVTPDISYVNYDVDVAALLDLMNVPLRQANQALRRSAVAQMLMCAQSGDWAQAALRVILI